jgi:hypothetical protein
MGIYPPYWGRQAWHFIHFVAYNYPLEPTEGDKVVYMNFLKSLSKVLPCPICGVHFERHMKEMPPRLDNRKEFFEWTIDMHNEVNKMNGKPILSYDEAIIQLKKNSRVVNGEENFDLSAKAHLLLRKIKNK